MKKRKTESEVFPSLEAVIRGQCFPCNNSNSNAVTAMLAFSTSLYGFSRRLAMLNYQKKNR